MSTIESKIGNPEPKTTDETNMFGAEDGFEHPVYYITDANGSKYDFVTFIEGVARLGVREHKGRWQILLQPTRTGSRRRQTLFALRQDLQEPDWQQPEDASNDSFFSSAATTEVRNERISAALKVMLENGDCPYIAEGGQKWIYDLVLLALGNDAGDFQIISQNEVTVIEQAEPAGAETLPAGTDGTLPLTPDDTQTNGSSVEESASNPPMSTESADEERKRLMALLVGQPGYPWGHRALLSTLRTKVAKLGLGN